MDVRALAERAGVHPDDVFTVVARGDTYIVIDRSGRKHVVPAQVDGAVQRPVRERPRRRRVDKEAR